MLSNKQFMRVLEIPCDVANFGWGSRKNVGTGGHHHHTFVRWQRNRCIERQRVHAKHKCKSGAVAAGWVLCVRGWNLKIAPVGYWMRESMINGMPSRDKLFLASVSRLAQIREPAASQNHHLGPRQGLCRISRSYVRLLSTRNASRYRNNWTWLQ